MLLPYINEQSTRGEYWNKANFNIIIKESYGPVDETFLMRVEKESEKAGLKLNIQKTKIMASNPITSRQIDGEKVETVTDFIYLGSKITVDMTVVTKLKDAFSLEEKLWQTCMPRQRI